MKDSLEGFNNECKLENEFKVRSINYTKKNEQSKKKNVGHHCTHFKVRVSEGEARQERSRVAPIVV